MLRKITLLATMLVVLFTRANAQTQIMDWLSPNFDSSYIRDHSKQLTVRFYGTTNFNQLKIGNSDNGTVLKYKTNDNFNIGAGFSYRFIGFSFSFKTPLVNNDEAKFGKTTGINLSTTAFYRRLTIDFFAQFNRGFYLSNNDVDTGRLPPGQDYLLRRDLKTRHIGFNGQYIFNNKKFSYRGAFTQSEYQKKSAGSFVIGGMLYYNRVVADSAIIPKTIIYPDFAASNDFYKFGTFVLALNAGYAYTFVYKKHYFITGGAALGAGLNYCTVTNSESHSAIGTQTNGVMRLASGYNSDVYYAGFTYQRQFARNSLPDVVAWQAQQFGGFQIILAKRFRVSKKLSRKFDDITNDVKSKAGLDVTPEIK